MRVARVEIERFLCFKTLTLDLDPHLQLIAGPNNAGKSSVVRLLEAFFSGPTPDQLVSLLPLNTYYKALGARTLSTIQVWFTDLTAEEQHAFDSILRRDGQIWLKVRCSRKGSISYEASRKASADEARRLYEELLQRFHFVKIPSVRVAGAGDVDDPESLERLLDTLEAILVRTGSSRSTALQQEYKQRMDPVEELVRDVLDESAAAIMQDLPFQEKDVKFRLPEPRHALRGMLESAVIETEGDATVPVRQRGTGFQSALVLGILRYIAQKESQSGANLMFAIEEPEAFLHPQTQRAMAKIISDIAGDAQVLVTTHSAVLVDSYGISQIARIPLQQGGTQHTWNAPTLEPTDEGRLSRYCSAANSELVFANAVIFVEGEGDFAVVEKLLSHVCRAPGGHYALGITVIEATGLTKIRYLVKLAEMFGVRSYVLADRDSTHNTGGDRELLTVLKERTPAPDQKSLQRLRSVADKQSNTLSQALAHTAALNKMLSLYDTFVLSSDLEGVLLDSHGVAGIVKILGPAGEDLLDHGFATRLLNDASAYDLCAGWMGSKGWNSARKPTNKLKPHLAPILVDAWFQENVEPPAAMKPLVTWLEEIVAGAHLAPV
jgi:putative ATP-dependent endonuclease of the OLD family